MPPNQMSTQEGQLCDFLKVLPRMHKNRYTEAAERSLLQSLFWSLAGGVQSHFNLFFPEPPPSREPWRLRKAQGGADGDEFTEAARGKACGHIFKAGEATYRCKTCSADDTCVLCSRCYDSSDHTGHMLYVSVSMGNSGCCDCGDPEAWRQPVHCGIHTAYGEAEVDKSKGKATAFPDELIESIRMTIGRAFDYICDVISCSPEHFRVPKTRQSILLDEKMSRLTSAYYGGDIMESPTEFALLIWNDEKHTVSEVKDQIARACKVSKAEATSRANATDDVGRSIIKYGVDLEEMLRVCDIMEQIKVTVTIRSARDTFREQMCGTLLEWLGDIAGCSVGPDHNILRQVICEEMLKKWNSGSRGTNADVGMKGIDDYEQYEFEGYRTTLIDEQHLIIRNVVAPRVVPAESSDEEEAIEEASDYIESQDGDESALSTDGADGGDEREETDIPAGLDGLVDAPLPVPAEDLGISITTATALINNLIRPRQDAGYMQDGTEDQTVRRNTTDSDGDTLMDILHGDAALEVEEATLAGYPPPPPPPPPPPALQIRIAQDRELTPSDSDTAEIQPLISQNIYAKANREIPKTPQVVVVDTPHRKPARYWLETSPAYNDRDAVPLHEDLWRRTRLDWLILFDLRMWKTVRTFLRDLLISTVVTIPEFKRILSLRFAGLYTTLAQLYLIADREPDHSIINISLQMLTTPSITADIVEKGNFLTNLMAILYTFLTTRQVGHPHEISPKATLSFDSTTVTNRRMYHFFMDLRYLFASEHVQAKLRTEDRYILQFLDLVKLHQGVCPNVRAVGEHVEYETDAWISASLITREINRLCRQFSESFKWNAGDNPEYISKAMRYTAKAVILHSLGAERKHFFQAEIIDEVKFKKVGDYEFDTLEASKHVSQHLVVKFWVDSQPISFHHALHYTLSWLIECAKAMPREQLIQLLSFTTEELRQKPKAMGSMLMPFQQYTPEDHLMAAFDYPLRVCAWLAQMKASMWVRNGMSLRHQQYNYRGVSQRDVCHHRDIVLLQTAMVVCPPARVLVSIIDRFGLEHWMKGLYEHKSHDFENGQVLDVVEDMIQLLIVLISDRVSLLPDKEEPTPHTLSMRSDITHVLCFKPLSFSDICGKLPDKFQDQEECQDLLDEMTIFKSPEGLSDVGTFELKPEYLEDMDPYIAHYNKNQREESETAYKNWMAKKTGRPASQIVFEPKLRRIESGAFSDLSAFTRTGIFAQIIYYSLLYPMKAEQLTPSVHSTRVEAFLQVVLHLVLIAIAEDQKDEDDMSDESLQSFVQIALTSSARSNYLSRAPASKTIVAILELLSRKEVFKACHPKIALVLKRMKQRRPRNFETAFARLGLPVDRISTASPAQNTEVADREKKKQAALERQAKVMAQFQRQQKDFLDNQGDIDWGEEDIDDENMDIENTKKYWHYPSGTCILCQEETGKDGRLFGTFALLTNSMILRQTNFKDADFVHEAGNTPSDLDRSADSKRPFGLARENREEVRKVNAQGEEIISERQFIGKGFPAEDCRPGPVSVGCGHIMHYKCFEQYYDASERRHAHQIARHHPERLEFNEFVCPLCKALGNTFLPVIWAPKEELYPGALQPRRSFQTMLESCAGHHAHVRVQRNNKLEPQKGQPRILQYFNEHNSQAYSSPLSRASEPDQNLWGATSPTPHEQYLPLFWRQSEDAAALSAGQSTESPLGEEDENAMPASPMEELQAIYRRILDTMDKNNLPTHHPRSIDRFHSLSSSDTLAKALGFSITSAEIRQRGVGCQTGMTFLETIPQQVLTHLRVLSETALSYVSVGGQLRSGENEIAKEFSKDYERQYYRLFQEQAYGEDSGSRLQYLYTPMLHQDIFIFLTECSLCLAEIDQIDIIHVIRVCYVAEIVKVLVELGRNMSSTRWLNLIGLMSSDTRQSGFDSFTNLCKLVRQSDSSAFANEDMRKALDSLPFTDISICRAFVRRYALTFLRKVLILLNVRYGLAFHSCIPSNPQADELDRLHEILKLESFDDLCYSATSTSPSPIFPNLVRSWINHVCNATWPDTLSLAHPVIYELIGLPKNYDTLLEETMRWRCPTTGKDITDAMLCLFCGEIFCGQSLCCAKDAPASISGRKKPDKIGGSQQHMLKCQKNIGLFINIRKCCVFYLYFKSGSWMVAPYIDRYGEVDPGLRHSRQLFLNQKRYDALLRTVWLSHGVPSVISRKLEMDINNGGWETI